MHAAYWRPCPEYILTAGTVSLNGKNGTKVLIDGKPAYLQGEELVSFLKSIPGTSLDKIELITNPSTRYDASNNSGLINIRTKKTRIMGLNLGVTSNQAESGSLNSSFINHIKKRDSSIKSSTINNNMRNNISGTIMTFSCIPLKMRLWLNRLELKKELSIYFPCEAISPIR